MKRITLTVGALLLGALLFFYAKNSIGQDQTVADKSEKAADPEVLEKWKNWPAGPKAAVEKMIAKYGKPDEVRASKVVWYKNGAWKRTMISKDEKQHNFPYPHTDYVEQVIDYKVPLDKYNMLASFDGSIMVNRTNGEIRACSEMEEMNLLALNLANDIITGKTTVAKAREKFAVTAADFKGHKSNLYVEGFQFRVASGGTADPDYAIDVRSVKKAPEKKNQNTLKGK